MILYTHISPNIGIEKLRDIITELCDIKSNQISKMIKIRNMALKWHWSVKLNHKKEFTEINDQEHFSRL